MRPNICQNIVEKKEAILGTGVKTIQAIQQVITKHNSISPLLVKLTTSVKQKKKQEIAYNLYSSSSLFNRKQFCTICRKPIEEKYVFDHYRKKHSKYMKESSKMGKQLSKAELGRGSRRRLIRQRLNVK